MATGKDYAVPPVDSAGDHGRRSIRVLLADDSSQVRRALLTSLRRSEGIEIVGEAETGQQAVEMACSLLPDLVLMDVSMPDIDGIQATRRIHARCPDVGVIGLTMYPDLTESMQDAGALACLDKWGSASALVAAIREHAACDG